MALSVNKKGKSQAMALVNTGKVDKEGSWAFSADDGNSLLGAKGDDWANYAKWFLAEDTSATENTKDRYKYPFGKDGKVFRAGIIAAKQRAAAQGETDIEAAADAVLQKIDKKDAAKMSEFSFSQRRELIEDLLNNEDDGNDGNMPMPKSFVYVQDLYDDHVVINDGGDLYDVPYTVANDGTVTLGDRKPCKVTYEALAELKDIEIVKTGDHVSADGAKVTYREADLDEMMKNAGELKDTVKPTIVVSHADGDLGVAINAQTVGAPQVGWMDPASLTKKKNADGSSSLLASFKDIAKNAVDKIGTDLKRVSAEIYKNYQAGDKVFGKVIRRVSFVPIPSIKNMSDVTQAHLVFGEKPDQPTTWVNLTEKTPESAASQAAAPAAGTKPTVPPVGGKENNDMDIEKLAEQVTQLSEVVTKLQEDNKAKDDQIKALQDENKNTTVKLSEVERTKRREDINRFLDDRTKEGKLSPALRVMGLDKFMQNLDDNTVVKFGEKSAEITPLAFMMRFLSAIPKNSIVRLGEIGGNGNDPNKSKEQKIVDRTQLAEMTPKDQSEFFKAGGKVID